MLVVDDELGPRESVAFALGGEFHVETADRGRTALRLVSVAEYDAVVLDIRMPEMDGIRTLEELRRIDPLVSVIMLTGYGTLQTAQQAMVGGAGQYLRKPPDVAELVDAVRRQVAATRDRRSTATQVGVFEVVADQASLLGGSVDDHRDQQAQIIGCRCLADLRTAGGVTSSAKSAGFIALRGENVLESRTLPP